MVNQATPIRPATAIQTFRASCWKYSRSPVGLSASTVHPFPFRRGRSARPAVTALSALHAPRVFPTPRAPPEVADRPPPSLADLRVGEEQVEEGGFVGSEKGHGGL